jgi:hypothetical protein
MTVTRWRLRALHVVLVLLPPSGAIAAQRSASDPARPAAEGTWMARVQEDLRTSEYRFSRLPGEAGVWSAPNRAQELRSRVSAEGIEVFPRTTSADGVGAEWKLVLGTRSLGREGDERALEPGAVSVQRARAELDRDALVEWFENGEEGIEQGWTIARRPGGIDPLLIGLAVGGLSLRLDEGGKGGVLVDAAGAPRLDYGGLRAWDAAGVALDVHLVPTPTGVAVRVVDDGAAYPITVDPVLTTAAWTAEPNVALAWLGYAVGTAGDVNGDGYSDVIVGAPLFDGGATFEGAAFVYHGSSSGLSSSAAWCVEGSQAGAQLGNAVGLAGDVNGDGFSDVIVGVNAWDAGTGDEGRALVFHGSAGGLSTTADWTVDGTQASEFLGTAAAGAGDVNGDGYSDVIVAATSYDGGEADEGRVLVYHGSASGLATSAAWTAESDQASADYGRSVSTAGDVNGDGYDDVIVGARLFDDGESDEGAVFVYHGSASGLAGSWAWSNQSNQADAWMGRSVSTAGDVNADGYLADPVDHPGQRLLGLVRRHGRGRERGRVLGRRRGGHQLRRRRVGRGRCLRVRGRRDGRPVRSLVDRDHRPGERLRLRGRRGRGRERGRILGRDLRVVQVRQRRVGRGAGLRALRCACRSGDSGQLDGRGRPDRSVLRPLGFLGGRRERGRTTSTTARWTRGWRFSIWALPPAPGRAQPGPPRVTRRGLASGSRWPVPAT